jgi:hypothetical protein
MAMGRIGRQVFNQSGLDVIQPCSQSVGSTDTLYIGADQH